MTMIEIVAIGGDNFTVTYQSHIIYGKLKKSSGYRLNKE